MAKYKKNGNYKQEPPKVKEKKGSAINRYAQAKVNQEYAINKGSLGAGGYLALIAGSLCLIASFVLSVMEYSFPYKQIITFFLMGLGAGTIAFFNNIVIKKKGNEKPTKLFWVLVILSVLYFGAGIYSIITGNFS